MMMMRTMISCDDVGDGDVDDDDYEGAHLMYPLTCKHADWSAPPPADDYNDAGDVGDGAADADADDGGQSFLWWTLKFYLWY